MSDSGRLMHDDGPDPVSEPKDPAPGEGWRHFKGGLYRVLCVAWVEATLESVVVYQSVMHGTIWTRPVEQFLKRFTREIEP